MKKEVILTAPTYQEARGRKFNVPDFVLDHCTCENASFKDGNLISEIYTRTPGNIVGSYQTFNWENKKEPVAACSAHEPRFVALSWQNPQANNFGIRRYQGRNCIAYNNKVLWSPHTRKTTKEMEMLNAELKKEQNGEPHALEFFGAFSIPGKFDAKTNTYENKNVPCYLYQGTDLVAYSDNMLGKCWYDVQPVYGTREWNGALSQSDIALFEALEPGQKTPSGVSWDWSETTLGKFVNKEYFISLFMTQDFEEKLALAREAKQAATLNSDHGREL